MEVALADIIALQLWRIQRAVRFEANHASILSSPQAAAPNDQKSRLRLLICSLGSGDQPIMSRAEAMTLVSRAANAVGSRLESPDTFGPDEWSGRQLLGVIWALSQKYGVDYSVALDATIDSRSDEQVRQTWRIDPDAFERMARYEAAAERSLHRNLNALERLQAKRLGHAVVPPIAVDLSVEHGLRPV
jgi:hypothetical protein